MTIEESKIPEQIFDNNEEELIIENTGKNIVGILNKSRFEKLNGRKILNLKTNQNVICRYERIGNSQKLYFENESGKLLSVIIYSFQDNLYYIDSLLSYEKGNGGFLLDLFLKEIGNKGVYLQDSAWDRFSGKILSNLYFKKGFRESDIQSLKDFNVYFKGKVTKNKQGKILFKYF